MPSKTEAAAYEAVPYVGGTHGLSHPDQLSTMAALCGMEPAPAGRCRVLDIGCADGGNLIPWPINIPTAISLASTSTVTASGLGKTSSPNSV